VAGVSGLRPGCRYLQYQITVSAPSTLPCGRDGRHKLSADIAHQRHSTTAQAATCRNFAIRSQGRARSARYKDGSSGGAASTDKQTQYKSEKADNLKYSKTKLPWFSCLLQHSVRKRGGLILQRPRAHTGPLIGGGKGQWLGGHHGECGARAYNWGLGAEPPAGSRGRAPGQGGKAPLEAESILVIGCPTDVRQI